MWKQTKFEKETAHSSMFQTQDNNSINYQREIEIHIEDKLVGSPILYKKFMIFVKQCTNYL